jgi:hypothetical protein
VKVSLPDHVDSSAFEIYIDSQVFQFHLDPYFLKLRFPKDLQFVCDTEAPSGSKSTTSKQGDGN